MPAELCATCKLPSSLHRQTHLGCLEAMDNTMTELLKNIGQMGTCSGCNGIIVWIKHRNGTHVPYTTEGLNHFINCPKSHLFGRDKK